MVAWKGAGRKTLEPRLIICSRKTLQRARLIRSTDQAIAGSKYRLWTTLKVPQGFSLQKHCEFLAENRLRNIQDYFRRKNSSPWASAMCAAAAWSPGSKSEELAVVLDTNIVELNDLDWRVLTELKRDFKAR